MKITIESLIRREGREPGGVLLQLRCYKGHPIKRPIFPGAMKFPCGCPVTSEITRYHEMGIPFPITPEVLKDLEFTEREMMFEACRALPPVFRIRF